MDNVSFPDLSRLTAQDIDRLAYPELVALMRETNRCPGGKRSINRIAQLALLDGASRVLEIGCSTGFTSLELATISRAQITGVDVAATAVEEAERRRRTLPDNMAQRVTFRVADLFDLNEYKEQIDLLIVGGATSFMRRKQEAVEMYKQLLRPYGLLSVTTLFYRTTPPPTLVERVGNTIGTRIDVLGRDAWLDLFTRTGLELYHAEEHTLEARPLAVIDAYVEYMMAQPHLASLSTTARTALQVRWRDTMRVFNENHQYLNFLLVLMRRNPFEEQPELFLPKGTITGATPV